MTEQTIDIRLVEIAEKFHSAAVAAAAALGLDSTPDVAAPVHGVSDALGEPATLGASMPVAGAVAGDLLLLTTRDLDGSLDDRALGGLTALSPRVRALRAAADVLGARHGDCVEADATDLSADLAAVLSLDGRAVGVLVLRQHRPEIEVVDDAPPEEIPASAPTAPVTAAAPAAPVTAAVPAALAEADPGFRSIVSGSVAAGTGPVATRLDQLTHVEMEVTVEIGRTRMTVGALLGLAPGQVVELDRPAGSPVDLFVNGTLLARGEVVVVDEDFGFRVTEIVSGREV